MLLTFEDLSEDRLGEFLATLTAKLSPRHAEIILGLWLHRPGHCTKQRDVQRKYGIKQLEFEKEQAAALLCFRQLLEDAGITSTNDLIA